MPMRARSRYYPRLADAKLTLRLTARVLLSTEARLNALHWHRLLPHHISANSYISAAAYLSLSVLYVFTKYKTIVFRIFFHQSTIPIQLYNHCYAQVN